MQCTVCTWSVPILHTLYTLHFALSSLCALCHRCLSDALCTARKHLVLSALFALAACLLVSVQKIPCKRNFYRGGVNCPNSSAVANPQNQIKMNNSFLNEFSCLNSSPDPREALIGYYACQTKKKRFKWWRPTLSCFSRMWGGWPLWYFDDLTDSPPLRLNSLRAVFPVHPWATNDLCHRRSKSHSMRM